MQTLYLKGDIGFEITAEKIKKDIDIKSTEALRVFVNSAGGWVFEAYEIYDLFKLYKGKIEFVLLPYAASAMSYVVMSGDKITGFKNSIWMGHKVWGIIIGDSDDLIREAGIMQGLENIIIEAYQTRLKFDRDEMRQKLKNELWAIGWEQLTELGLIDNVLDNYDEIEIPEDVKEDIESSMEEAAKSNIDQIISMKIKKIEARIRDEKSDYKNAYERIAAKINIDELNAFKPVKPENNIKLEANMNLQEFLKANPEAKAEFDEALREAREEGQALGSVDVNAERQRIFNMIKDSGVGISKELADAINHGTPDLEFARAELGRQREKRNNNKSGVDFGSLVISQTPGDQDKTTQNELKNKKKSDEEFDKETDAMVSKINEVGGKK